MRERADVIVGRSAGTSGPRAEQGLRRYHRSAPPASRHPSLTPLSGEGRAVTLLEARLLLEVERCRQVAVSSRGRASVRRPSASDVSRPATDPDGIAVAKRLRKVPVPVSVVGRTSSGKHLDQQERAPRCRSVLRHCGSVQPLPAETPGVVICPPVVAGDAESMGNRALWSTQAPAFRRCDDALECEMPC